MLGNAWCVKNIEERFFVNVTSVKWIRRSGFLFSELTEFNI